MSVDVFRCRPLHRVAELPSLLWLSIHLLLYLGVGAVGLALWDPGSDAPDSGTLLGRTIVVLFFLFSPLVALVSVASTFCLGVLRLMSAVRWYWFRLAAILLFAVPFPLFLLSVNGPETDLPVAAIQMAAALLIVQPRERPGGWADRDPAMKDRNWIGSGLRAVCCGGW